MKRAEVQIPDSLYQQMEKLAQQLHSSVPELLCRSAEQWIHRQTEPSPKTNGKWALPKGHSLGAFVSPEEDWRMF